MGQLLLQLGHVDKRVISKFQKKATEIGKSSFALAWVFDTDESERERGVTMEVGTKFAKTKSHDIVILDAPGHKVNFSSYNYDYINSRCNLFINEGLHSCDDTWSGNC